MSEPCISANLPSHRLSARNELLARAMHKSCSSHMQASPLLQAVTTVPQYGPACCCCSMLGKACQLLHVYLLAGLQEVCCNEIALTWPDPTDAVGVLPDQKRWQKHGERLERRHKLQLAQQAHARQPAPARQADAHVAARFMVARQEVALRAPPRASAPGE